MSDRPCNYCEFEEMKRDARKRGVKLRTQADPLVDPEGREGIGMPGGTRVIEVAKDGSERERIWFGALPDHCCC